VDQVDEYSYQLADLSRQLVLQQINSQRESTSVQGTIPNSSSQRVTQEGEGEGKREGMVIPVPVTSGHTVGQSLSSEIYQLEQQQQHQVNLFKTYLCLRLVILYLEG